MSYAAAHDEPGGAAPAALSLFVHALLFAFLFFGIRWQVKAPEAVMVELWNAPPAAEPARVEPAPKIEPPPQPEPKVEPPPKPEPKLEPRIEPKVEPRPHKPDIAIEREKKPPKKEEPSLKLDANKRIQEELAREQQALSQSRAKPEVPRTAPPAAASSIDAAYTARVAAKIKANIVVPPDILGNPEAIFDVVQLPTGEVLSAKLRKSSGHKAYDDAIERAIIKASPLPKPDKGAPVPRELTLKFRPQD